MATPRKRPAKPTGERSSNRHKHPHVGLNMEQSLIDLLDEEAGVTERTRSSQIIFVLKEYFRAKGKWPPAS